MSFPKPKGAILGMMVAVFCIWLASALAVNWRDVTPTFLAPFIGSASLVLHGQVWRLLTAGFVHLWSGDGAVSHILTTVACLYFFGPQLEDRWGWKKTLAFLFGSTAFAFTLQTIIGALVPKLDQREWFGGLGMCDALVVAWALQARADSRVLLFFVLPVSPRMLIGFTLLMNILKVIAIGGHLEGLVTPFGGMLAGYLFGDTSPLRRYWLQLRLKRLQSEVAGMKPAKAKARASGPALRVIRGGGDDPPKDKRYLN
jgi:membrane associated rhomboid family serine protease